MIKRIFWSGIKAFVPIALTIAIVYWVLKSIEAFFGYFLHYLIPPKYYFNGLGIIVGIAIIFLIGFLVNAWLVRRFYLMAERVVKRIPVIKTIYNAIQDLVNFFDKSRQAQQAVMIQTPMGNVVGFITRNSLQEMSPVLGTDQQVLVYVPFSYLIGGITMVVTRAAITPLDWPVNQAMSFILTAGMTGQKVESK